MEFILFSIVLNLSLSSLPGVLADVPFLSIVSIKHSSIVCIKGLVLFTMTKTVAYFQF